MKWVSTLLLRTERTHIWQLVELTEAPPGLLWNCFSQFLSSCISTWGGNGKRLAFSFSFRRNKAWKKVWICGSCWKGSLTALFSCFRRIIFCKFTVTSVLFSVYYIDSKLTLKCNGGVPDHRVFTVCVRACISIRRYECVYVYMMARGMKQENEKKILTRHTLHFKDISPGQASSVFLILTLLLTHRFECV